MANAQVGPLHAEFVHKAKAAGDSTMGYSTPANYDSITAMRTRLAAINGSYYTTAFLDAMTTNDMIYAIRLNDDAAAD